MNLKALTSIELAGGGGKSKKKCALPHYQRLINGFFAVSGSAEGHMPLNIISININVKVNYIIDKIFFSSEYFYFFVLAKRQLESSTLRAAKRKTYVNAMKEMNQRFEVPFFFLCHYLCPIRWPRKNSKKQEP